MAVTDYFSELEAVGSNSATPSPVGTTYHTPRASMSRRPSSRRTVSSRRASSSPPRDASSSPPPLPVSSPGTNATNDEAANEGDILFDPRRFTPTLHASLVSEILNLRRELDSKDKFIEDLEVSLQHAKTDRDEVADQLSLVEKDRRNLKRQFQNLENGTLSALEELAKDRDATKKQNADLKVKWEDAQETIKRKSEESDRAHDAWEKERNAWETERRAFDRRVHITESRLKAVLSELEAAHQAHSQMHDHFGSGEDDDNTKDSGLGEESDTASQASPRRYKSHKRSLSNSSRRSFNRFRFSVQSTSGGDGPKVNGVSLADELQLDEEDEDALSEADSEYPHQEFVPEKSVVAGVNHTANDKRKRLSAANILQAPVEFGYLASGVQDSISALVADPLKHAVQYADSGIQVTPPSSPNLKPQLSPPVLPIYCDIGIQFDFSNLNDSLYSGPTAEPGPNFDAVSTIPRANTSTPPMVDRAVSPFDSPSKSRSSMVSVGSQSMEEPLSPPATPGVSPPLSPTEFVQVAASRPEFKTIATQTCFPDESKSLINSIPERKPIPITIPSITITEPPSAPSSPGEPKLPPGTKNVSCQTTVDLVAMNSVSVQTEEIRIDTRLAKLPPHLHPSAVMSNINTTDIPKSRPSIKTKRSLVGSYIDVSAFRSASSPTDDLSSSSPISYPISPIKGVDLGTAYEHISTASERVEGLRKLLRSSVLAPSSPTEEVRPERDDAVNRSDFIPTEPKVAAFSTPNVTSRSMKHLRQLVGTRPSPVPEEKDEPDYAPEPISVQTDHAVPAASGRSSVDTDKSKSGRAVSIKSVSSKHTNMRRSAMIQNSSAAHRSRTPSMTSVGSSSYFSSRSAGPPYPVPDRGSSRKLFESRSEGSSSPTPRSGIFGSRKRTNVPLTRKDSLRKVKSAAAIQRSNSRGRNRSRSPPLRPVPLSPSYPPLPKDNIAIPAKVYPSQKSGEKRLSRPLSPSSKPELARASQGTVVDAIAAAMVGEWMWKYVRRKTSFGVSESPQEQMGRPGTDGSINVTGNGARHKRWVWLSPYERAIMWSSKQPASNSALMGKSGRKLVIQSVLDVRDDTPLPKNHGIVEPFNRSILILTPARALKFTATSRERHYIWLTALSFLAHSPLLAPGLANLPLPPQEPEDTIGNRVRSSTLKRGGAIRDSVRIAKDRARPIRTPKSDHSQATIPEVEFHAAFGSNIIPPILDLPAEAAAEPPNVPRFAHSRKRSLTGPSRMPTSGTTRNIVHRGVSSPAFPTTALPSPTVDYGSGRASTASSSTRTAFLDTVGTIRMDAFIEKQHGLHEHSPEVSSRRRGNLLHSPMHSGSKRTGVILSDEFDIGGGFDPFKDFNR